MLVSLTHASIRECILQICAVSHIQMQRYNLNHAAYYACITTAVEQHFGDRITSNYLYNLGTLAISLLP
jgi:hypothetical protein